jgi:putative spermidine/putrescine transport system permease protein
VRVSGAVLWMITGIIVLYLLAPIVVVVATAFTTTAYPVFPPRGFTFKWFLKFMATEEFRSGIRLSFLLALASAALAVALGTLTALALARYRPRAQAALSAFVLSPILFPGIVLGLALLIYFHQTGLAGSFWSLVAAHAVLTTPFVIRMVMASLAELDPSLEEAARNLGAGWWGTFFLVTVPLIRPGLLAGAIFAFIISFDELVITLFIAGPKLTTLPIRIFTYVEYASDPTISAISTALIAVWIAVGVPIYTRFFGVRHR